MEKLDLFITGLFDNRHKAYFQNFFVQHTISSHTISYIKWYINSIYILMGLVGFALPNFLYKVMYIGRVNFTLSFDTIHSDSPYSIIALKIWTHRSSLQLQKMSFLN